MHEAPDLPFLDMASGYRFVLVISVKGDTFLARIRVTTSIGIRRNIHRKKKRWKERNCKEEINKNRENIGKQ